MGNVIKLKSILEIENTCTGKKIASPYITHYYFTSFKNSVLDGTWKITKKL